MQAAIVVYGAERVSQLERALQSRDVIGQAKGILMHRDGIDAATAFAKLVRRRRTPTRNSSTSLADSPSK